MKRHCKKAKDTKMAASSSIDIAGSGAEGTSSQRRYRRKRQINYDDYVFDETSDVVDKQTENVSHRSRFSTVGRTTDTTVADGLECPKTLSNLKARKEKLKSTYVSTVHSGSLSNACETSVEDADGVRVTRSRLRDTDSKRKYQFKKTAGTDRSHSATVSDVLTECARSESVVASKKQTKSKLCPSSSVGSSSIPEPTVSNDLAGASAASLLFNHTVSQFQPHAAIDSSHEDLASHDNVNAQDTASNHHMVRNAGSRFRADSRGIADDHTQNAAVSNNSYNGSRKEHLKKMKSHLESLSSRTRMHCDSDDDDNDDNDNRFDSRTIAGCNTQTSAVSVSNANDSQSCHDDDDDENHNELTVGSHYGTLSQINTACHGPESVVRDVSSDDDVIIISSSDKPSADVESVNGMYVCMYI